MKKILKKILDETDWEPFLNITGVAVTVISIVLPVTTAVGRGTVWGLSTLAVTGPVCGLYWSVVKSFCDRNYR